MLRCNITPLCVLFFFRFVLCVYIFNPRDEGRGGEGCGGERGDGKKKRAGCCRFKNCNLTVPPNPRKAVSAETQ